MPNRRSFLKTGALTAGAASAAALTSRAATESTEQNPSASAACAVDGYGYRLPSFKPGSRLVFQGDSITDMNRGRNESDRNHYLGHSYVFLIAGRLGVDMPEARLDIYNRGISGNAVWQLRKRWQKDAVDMKPDLLSILIGTNDIGQGLRDPKRRITPASFESDYRFILDASRKANPELRLVLLDPFVLPTGGLKNEQAWKSRSEPTAVLREVVAKLATDYEAVHIRTQDIFDKAAKVTGPENLIWDGIHPLPAGHELIARHWIQAVSERWPKNRE
jgi:lysophospholipase L1-like esterase